MSYSYPLTLPTSPGFRDARFKLRDLIAVSESPFTFERQSYDWNAQQWQVSLSLPPMKRPSAEPWITTFLKLRGRRGTFLLGDPDAITAQGVATGAPVVNGAHSARSLTLATTGWTVSTAGILKAGDYLQLGTGSSSRLHKVLTDADSDASGNATLDILPALRTDLADGASIIVSEPKGLFRLTAEVEWNTDLVSLFGISFDCVEAL